MKGGESKKRGESMKRGESKKRFDQRGYLLEFGGFVEKACRAVGMVGLVADHNDDSVRVASANDAKELDPAFIRQVDVEEQDVRRMVSDQRKRFTVAARITNAVRRKQSFEHGEQPFDD